MAQQDDHFNDRVNPPENQDRRYEETVDPKNPPNSVLQPAARTAALTSTLGLVVVLAIVAAIGLAYWTASGRRIAQDPGERGDSAVEENREIGTAGERSPDPSSPGGTDPAGRPGSTADELDFRGAEDRGAGARDLTPRAEATKLADVFDMSPASAGGRAVDLRGVEVASVEGSSFWVHDGNDKMEVVAPAGAAAVRPGQKVDVSGTVESNGRSSVRIRASRVQ